MISPRPLHACSIAYLSFKRDGGEKGCQSLSTPAATVGRRLADVRLGEHALDQIVGRRQWRSARSLAQRTNGLSRQRALRTSRRRERKTMLVG